MVYLLVFQLALFNAHPVIHLILLQLLCQVVQLQLDHFSTYNTEAQFHPQAIPFKIVTLHRMEVSLICNHARHLQIVDQCIIKILH